jgi:hypothetical protein
MLDGPATALQSKTADRIEAEVSEVPDRSGFFTAYVRTFSGNDPVPSEYSIASGELIVLETPGTMATCRPDNRNTKKDGADSFRFKIDQADAIQTELYFRIPGSSKTAACSVLVFDITKIPSRR